MTSLTLADRVRLLVAAELPRWCDVESEAVSIADGAEIGRSEFLRLHGLASEIEYKRSMMAEGRIMYHMHIGLDSWTETAAGLRDIYAASVAGGFVIDRFGVALDRRMGLPQELRAAVPSETGPMLQSRAEWLQLGSTVPIQPHMGDFIIGFPASVENTLNCLAAGVTTIGNLSQFFTHDVPSWRDDVSTLKETVKALRIMGALRERGTLVHSYLDDGMGALFLDVATVAGWAYLERYIVETLLGGKLGHCAGGLITDPEKRMAWIFALERIHEGDCVGTMFFGDTLSFTDNFNRNTAHVGDYLLWDMLAQLACPTGHALLPVPVTEAIRIPSVDEIASIQEFGHRVEATARRIYPFFDFTAARALGERIAASGRIVFENALSGLRDMGVDVRDPLRLLYVLKRMGADSFEEQFGAGQPDPSYPRGRCPVLANDVFELSNSVYHSLRPAFLASSSLEGVNALLASTDVHIHALYIIERLLADAGASVINLGAEVNPPEIAKEALSSGVNVLLVSTHNGMALEYAHNLLEELRERGAAPVVIMGGVLNQKTADGPYPVDVSAKLREIGVLSSSDGIGGLAQLLRGL